MKIFAKIPYLAMHQVRALFAREPAPMLVEGSRAPDFSLGDESGNTHRLSQYQGKRVILWWFVLASTPG